MSTTTRARTTGARPGMPLRGLAEIEERTSCGVPGDLLPVPPRRRQREIPVPLHAWGRMARRRCAGCRDSVARLPLRPCGCEPGRPASPSNGATAAHRPAWSRCCGPVPPDEWAVLPDPLECGARRKRTTASSVRLRAPEQAQEWLDSMPGVARWATTSVGSSCGRSTDLSGVNGAQYPTDVLKNVRNLVEFGAAGLPGAPTVLRDD